jgi:hypothetical protein
LILFYTTKRTTGRDKHEEDGKTKKKKIRKNVYNSPINQFSLLINPHILSLIPRKVKTKN